MLNTQEESRCPKCNNEDVYLILCHKLTYKVCDQCKTISLCLDACETFTDPDMRMYHEENPDKSIEDYEKYKLNWMEETFQDYTIKDHPKTS